MRVSDGAWRDRPLGLGSKMKNELEGILSPQMHRGKVLRRSEARRVPFDLLGDLWVHPKQDLSESSYLLLERMIECSNERLHRHSRFGALPNHLRALLERPNT